MSLELTTKTGIICPNCSKEFEIKTEGICGGILKQTFLEYWLKIRTILCQTWNLLMSVTINQMAAYEVTRKKLNRKMQHGTLQILLRKVG